MFTAALLTTANTQKQPRYPSIDEWIKKLWYIHTMQYYSAIEREYIWVSSNEVDEPRAYYTESERESQKEKKISQSNSYVWNLERWYWWIYLKGSNGDTDIENRLVDTEGKKVGPIERVAWNMYITICKIGSWWELAVWCRELKPSALWPPRGSGGVGGGREVWGLGRAYVCLWLIPVDVRQKSTQYCKAIILWLKISIFKKCSVNHTIQGLFLKEDKRSNYRQEKDTAAELF